MEELDVYWSMEKALDTNKKDATITRFYNGGDYEFSIDGNLSRDEALFCLKAYEHGRASGFNSGRIDMQFEIRKVIGLN